MNILFKAYFHNKISNETWPIIYLGQDPDPNPESDPVKKWSGSATLLSASSCCNVRYLLFFLMPFATF
jgi:hypothetical protein